MHIKSVPIQVKAGPEDGLADGEFVVYPSTFTRTPDSYGDVIAKGAFARTISDLIDSGDVLPALYGHRLDDPDFYVGGAAGVDMSEDDHGWRVKGQFDLESPKGNQVYRLVKGRRLTQLSFAYDVMDSGTVTLDDGSTANELRDLKVYEFSFVPVGANQDTSVVAVKSNADAIVDGMKAGRVLSAKNEDELRSAHESIGRVLAALTPQDEGKASVSEPVKDDEPTEVKSDEPMRETSARAARLLQLQLNLMGDSA